MKITSGNDCGGFQSPKGHLDTQMFPECEGTETDRNIVKKTRERRKKKKKTKKAFNLLFQKMIREAISQTDENQKIPGRGLPVVTTPGALEKFDRDILAIVVKKFMNADFGDIGESDKQSNMETLEHDETGWMLGSYLIGGEKVWVICDGVAVTVLLPEEY